MLLSRIILASTIATVAIITWFLARADGERVFFMDLGRPLTAADRARATRVRLVTLVSCGGGVAAAVLGPITVAALLATLVPFVPIAWLMVEVVGAVRSAELARAPLRFRVPLAEPPPARAFVSLPLQLAHVALLLLSTAGFALVKSALPELVPLHFDVAGRPDRWGSPDELWGLLGIMLFDYALLWIIVRGTAAERWALPSENPEAYARASRRRRELLVRLVETLMLAVNGAVAVAWLGIAVGSLPGNGALIGVSVAVTLVLSTLGTIGSLVYFMRQLLAAQDELKKLGGATLGTRPDGWRWRGMIYYAPDDPALWIPKRFGVGQTLNFARPGAWVFLAFTLLVPVGIAVLAMLVSRR